MTEPSDQDPVLDRVDGMVARITINRPERRNALSPEVVAGIASALSRAEEQGGEVRAVVLTGAGDRAFCAGGDLAGMSADGNVARHFERGEIGRLFSKMRESRLPIVARVNGHALAGGFGLMLACDLVVASERAEMGMPEVNIGLWPFMVTAVVKRDLPRKVAFELMLSGRKLKAHDAQALGLVNRVAPYESLDDAVGETLELLLSKSPVTVALGKRSFYRAEDMAFDDALEYLSGMLTVCLESEDAIEGVSAFLEKRNPQWRGR